LDVKVVENSDSMAHLTTNPATGFHADGGVRSF